MTTDLKRCPTCGGFHSIGQIDSVISGVMNNIDNVLRDVPASTRNEAEKAYDRMKERGIMLSDASFTDVDNGMAFLVLSFQSLQYQMSMVVQTIEKAPIAACAFLSTIRDSTYTLSRSCTDLISALNEAIQSEQSTADKTNEEDQIL